MSRIFTLFLALLISSVSFGQNNHWKKSSSSRMEQSKKLENLSKYSALELDFEGLKRSLSSAIHRSAGSISTTLVSFPNHNGELEVYEVKETSTLHPELAKKFPGIMSFAGQGVKNGNVIRFSISDQRGLHGMIMSTKDGMTYIDPVSDNLKFYAAYHRSSLSKKDKEFQCMTEESIAAGRTSSEGAFAKTNDKKLRKYRLALSCNAEYGNIFAGEGTDQEKKARILAQMNISMTRVNGVYERDLAITMELVANNDELIYFGDVNSDPWTNEFNSKTQEVIDDIIGDANYDIGHNFNTTGGGNAGCIGCVCTSGSKGSAYTGRANPTGDPFDIDYVAHEIGHQFGGYHTQSNSSCRSGDGTTEVEPGSGSTIMGYAGICSANVQNNSDAYFHYVNIRDISANIQTGVSSSCPTVIELTNNPPTAEAGDDFTIPASTPFVLRGAGTDPDGDEVTYTWEQNDPENTNSNSTPDPTWTQGPLFRSREGTSSPNRYMPQMSDILAGEITPTWEVLPSVSRTMEFALTVRDNNMEAGQTNDDLMMVTVDGDSGPFKISEPNTAISWYVGQSQIVAWDVANTDQAPVNCSNVNILMSTDGGATFPITLANNVPNNGQTEVVVPDNISATCRIKIEAVGNIFFDISDTDYQIEAAVACTASVPTGLAASGITSSTASLTWDENVGAIFDVQYRVSGQENWTTIAAGGNSKTITGLTQLTSYDVRVRSRCTNGSSEYSSIVSFDTPEQELVYCANPGGDTSDEYIGRVQLADIDNTSGTSNGYQDFTSISTNLVLGTEYTITITPTWTANSYNDGYGVWIDFNRNGSFDDSGEMVLSKAPSKETPVSGTFAVPSDGVEGETRMRVALRFNAIPASCGGFPYGEVEDYTVILGKDEVAPTLKTVSITSNYDKDATIAGLGDEVSLSFEASEKISVTQLMLAGKEVTPTYDENSSRWTAKRVMVDSDELGVVGFVIKYKDLSENVGVDVTETTDESSVEYVGKITSVDRSGILAKSISIHPNPSSGLYNLNVEGDTGEKYSVQVTNVLGEVMVSMEQVSAGKLADMQLDLSDKPNGIYVLKIGNDKTSSIHRIVKN